MITPKASNEFEMRGLSDGRVGVFKNGLCIHVAHDKERAEAWWKAYCTTQNEPKLPLADAVRRLG